MRLPEEDDERDQAKKCLEDEEEEEEGGGYRHPAPPDGGWGWCIMAASFFCIVMVDGVCYSVHAIYQPVQERFNASNFQVGLMNSMMAGCYLLVGPFVSALCGRYSCRRVTVAGSVLATCGIALSTQVSSMEMMILLYGIVTGIGFGMIYLPSIVCVGYWFHTKRAFATGIALCGSGVGQFLIPPLTTYLLEEFHLSGALVIVAGLVLNCAVCGMCYFPLDQQPKKRRARPTHVEIQHGAIMKALIQEKKRQRTISNGSLDNCIITRDNRLVKLDPKIFEVKRNNSFIARFKRQLGFSSQSLACSQKSLQGIPSIVIDAVQKDLNNSKLANGGGSANGSPIYRPNGTRVQQLSQSEQFKRSSLPNGGPPGHHTNGTIPNGVSSSALANGSVSPLGEASAANGFPKTRSCDNLPPQGEPWVKMDGVARDPRVLSLQHVSGGGSQGSQSGDEANTPMFIVGGGDGSSSVLQSCSDLQGTPILHPNLDGSFISIQVIPNGVSQQSLRLRSSNSFSSQAPSQSSYASSASVMSIHVQESLAEIGEEEGAPRASVLWKFWLIVCEMFAFKVLMNPVFAVLVLSTFISMLGFFVPYLYLPELLTLQNPSYDASPSTYLVSVIGVANTVGRVLTGWFADRPWVNTLYLNNAALMVGGLAVAVSPLLATTTFLSVCAACFGLTIAVFNSLRSILLVDLLGLETLTKSFGLLILFQGIAALLSGQMAGLIFDIMGSPSYALHLAGAFMVLSGLIMFLIHCLPNRLQHRKPHKGPYMPGCSAPITETLKLESGC